MAIALPVMSAIAAVSALAFWIGWTMFTAESEELEELGEEMAEEAAEVASASLSVLSNRFLVSVDGYSRTRSSDPATAVPACRLDLTNAALSSPPAPVP